MSKVVEPPPPKAEAPPLRRYKAFPKYPLSEVRETARFLFRLQRPFPAAADMDDRRWHGLARQANDFLDKLTAACEHVAEQRLIQDEAYRRAERRKAEAGKLPSQVDFKKAAAFITGERHTKRAEQRLIKLLCAYPRYFFGLNEAVHANEKRSLLRQWRKHGMLRSDVIGMQRLFEIRQNNTKRRRQRQKNPATSRTKPRE